MNDPAAKDPVRVAVTGAAGQIGYSLLFRIASGAMLGPDQPVELRMLEIPPAMGALDGVMMVKPGAAVVGGGITREGRKILSDVDESVGEVAGWVTPRLGGVGPMTRALLLANTVDAAAAGA